MKSAPVAEFRRLVRLDELDDGEITREFEAGADECRALARRFDLVSIDSLRASARLRRISGGPLVRVEGRLNADVVQRCVVTLADLPAHIEEDFAETFGPAGYRAPDDDANAERPAVFDDDSVDVGELAAQLLLLSLDPYPRAPDADAVLQPEAAGDAGGRARPFADLGEILDKHRK